MTHTSYGFLTAAACYEFITCGAIAQKMPSCPTLLLYANDEDYPLPEHAIQRPVKVGKHSGLGSGMAVNVSRVPSDVIWDKLHTWTAPDPFLDGIIDPKCFQRHLAAYGTHLLRRQGRTS
jgi:hypothetical protein